MIIVKDPAVIFYHNPKCAGSAINFWFKDNIPGCYHIEPQHIIPRKTNVKGWSFCVVRNPWDRWVSWWYFWRVKKKRIDIPFEEYTIKYFNGEYVRLGNGEGRGQWGNIGDQYEMAKDVDCVLRYENLAEDFKIVQKKLSCSAPLLFANVNYGRKHYTRYYTSDKLIELVAEYHKRDIETYGYKYAL